MKDYTKYVGCWIDSAIPKEAREIAERLTELAVTLNADSDQLAHENDDMSDSDTQLWLQECINDLDTAINDVINPAGFLALWEGGDYVIIHQSDYEQ